MQCFQRNNDEKIISDMLQSTKEDQNIAKYQNLINRITFACYPHKFNEENDPFMRNPPEMLMAYIKNINKNWPKYTIPKNNVLQQHLPEREKLQNELIDTINFYRNISCEMLANYRNYLIQQDIMKTYEDVISNPLIDMTKLPMQNKSDKSNIEPRTMTIDENSKQYMEKQYNWFTFCPTFETMAIRANKQSYILIEFIEFDKSKQYIEAKISVYKGKNKEWMLNSISHISMQFNNKEGKTACVYKWIDGYSYEEIISMFVKDMHWDNKKTNLWYDIFGACDIDDIAIVKLPNMDKNSGFIVNRMSEFKPSIKQLSIDMQIIKQKSDVFDVYHDMQLNIIFETYIQTIGIINCILFTEPRIEISKNQYKFGDLLITANNYPIIPSEKHTIRIKSKKDK